MHTFLYRSNSADSSLMGDIVAAVTTNHRLSSNNLLAAMSLRNPPPARQELSHRRVELGAAEELSIGGDFR